MYLFFQFEKQLFSVFQTEKTNTNIHDFTDVKNICIISDLQIHKGAILLDHNRINSDIQFLLDFNI